MGIILVVRDIPIWPGGFAAEWVRRRVGSISSGFNAEWYTVHFAAALVEILFS